MNAPIDVTSVRIETDRLILRPWQESDLEDFFEYARVEGVGEMAGWPHHPSIETSRLILDLFLRERKTFALELKESGKVIGSLGLEELNPESIGGDKLGREIGYVLSKEYWGMGLMPEAVRAVVSYCFDTLNYDFLTCGHFLWNQQSRRVVEKCGFQYLMEVSYKTQSGRAEISRLYVLNHPNK